MSEQVLRLFVSSPGDVASERRRVDLVVERLNAEYAGRVRIETIRWETSYYSAHDTFQKQIPEAADCDVVVAIFRARLGSPLPPEFHPLPSGEPYPSGTAYEILSAIEVRKAGHRVPDVYVFRYPNPPQVTLDTPERNEIETQWGRLKQFFERWFRTSGGEFIAAFQDYASTDDFAAKVEDCLRQWLEKRGFGALDQTWDRILLGPPFPGLPAFDGKHTPVFFGRDLAISQSIERLRDAGSQDGRKPFLLIIGASGSGKSSLLRAGILPRLVLPGTIPDIDLWRTAVVMPGHNPFESLAEGLFSDGALADELRGGTFRTKDLLAKQLAADPEIAIAPIRDALAVAAEQRRADTHFEAARPARIALAIDQGERLFVETDPALAESFAKLVAALVEHDLAYVIFVLRSDTYAHFQRSEALVALREAGATFDLVPPNLAELEEIVTRPPALCRPPLEFETAGGASLATQLVRDAKGGDALPLLQMTLARLYAAETERGDGVLRFVDYRGMDAAVTETANEALGSVDEEARAELPALVTRLVADIANDPVTGAAVPIIAPLDRAEFESVSSPRHALVEAFVARRLLAAEGDGEHQRVRPVHEALLRIWPEAVAIVAEAGNLIRVRHTLEPIVAAWTDAGSEEKARHLDISPALLSGAEALIERFGTDLSPAMRAFIDASIGAAGVRAAREREEQERRVRDAERLAAANRRIAQRTGAGLVLTTLLAGVAGWFWYDAQNQRQFAVQQQGLAEAQRDRAEHSLTIAVDAANSLVNDLGRKFQNSLGVSKATTKEILQQALSLQAKLSDAGEVSDALKTSQADALIATSETLMSLGDPNGALDAGEKATDIVTALSAAKPGDIALKRSLAIANERVGMADLALGRLPEAMSAFLAAAKMLNQQLIQFKEQSRDPDPAVLFEFGMALDRGGQVQIERNDFEGALSLFLGSLEELKALKPVPNNDLIQRNIAIVYSHIARAKQALLRLDEAEAALKSSLDLSVMIAEAQSDDIQAQRELGRVRLQLSDLQFQRVHNDEALKTVEAGIAVFARLASADPLDLEIQRDLGAAYAQAGIILSKLARPDDAKARYIQAFDIAKRLVATTPGNSGWQHDLSTAYGNLGDALMAEGKAGEALADFQAALKIADALLDSAPTRELWQADRGAMLTRLGDAQAALQKLADAEASYRESAEVRRYLVAHYSREFLKRYDLILTLTRLGDLLSGQKRLAEALTQYQQLVVACEGALKIVPGNIFWTRKLQLGLVKIGDTQAAQEAYPDALKTYQRSLDLMLEVVKAPEAEPSDKIDLVFAYNHVGDMQLRLNAFPDALAAFHAGLDLAQTILAAEPDNQIAQRTVAVQENRIGTVFLVENKPADAFQTFKPALEIVANLVKTAPDNKAWQADLQFTFNKLGFAAGGLMRSRDFAGALEVADFILAHPQAPGWAHLARANALMFLGRADEAKAEHAQERGTKPLGDKTWEEVVTANFAELKGLGLSDPLMDEILASFATPK